MKIVFFLLLKFVIFKSAKMWLFHHSQFTEARSEASIELKLVRKPPKVSRGYGGGARGRAVHGLPDFRGALSYNQGFGGRPKTSFSGLPIWAPRRIHLENPGLPGGHFGSDSQDVHIPTVPGA